MKKTAKNWLKWLIVLVAMKASAGGGGMDGGNGDSITQPVTREEIKYTLQTIFNLNSLHFVFLRVEALSKGISGGYLPQKMMTKLFEKKKHRHFTGNIYDAIHFTRLANIELREKGPCWGPTGLPSDMAVNEGLLCISLERLEARKLSTYNMPRRLMTLLAHEMTHIVGFNENEAKALEDRLHLGRNTKIGLAVFQHTKFGLSRMIREINSLLNMTPQLSETERASDPFKWACSGIWQIYEQAHGGGRPGRVSFARSREHIFQAGMSVLSNPGGIRPVLALVDQHLLSFCYDDKLLGALYLKKMTVGQLKSRLEKLKSKATALHTQMEAFDAQYGMYNRAEMWPAAD